MFPTLTTAPLGALPGLPDVLTLAAPAGPQTADFTALLAAELTSASPAMLAATPIAPADPAADPAAAPAASGGNILPVFDQTIAAIVLPAAAPIVAAPVVATPPLAAGKLVVTAPAAPPAHTAIVPPAQTKSHHQHPAMPAIAAEPAPASDAEIEPELEIEPECPTAAPAELALPPRSIGLAAVPATHGHPGPAPAHTASAHIGQTSDERHSDAPAPTLAPAQTLAPAPMLAHALTAFTPAPAPLPTLAPAAPPAPFLSPGLTVRAAPVPSDIPDRRTAAIAPHNAAHPALLVPAAPAPPPPGLAAIAKAAVALPEAAATMPAAPERGDPQRAVLPIRIELAAAAPASAPAPKSGRASHAAAPVLLEPASPPMAGPLAPGLTAAASIMPAPSAMPAAGPGAMPAAADRPLDFTAVLDRLIAAREAVQPQPAALTVAHSEFGPVRLHFAQDERGLAVTLASADPDFARAVAAAAPPVSPANTAQSAGMNAAPGQRGDPSSTGQGAAGNQPRGPHAERRDEPPARAGQPFEHSARSVGQPARHRGIFA